MQSIEQQLAQIIKNLSSYRVTATVLKFTIFSPQKEMQSMDQHLARQLLSLRHDIHQLRLSRSCQQHRELLDDVQSELEEQEELSDVLDLPSSTLSDTPLKQIGVTRMNISARRFSTC